MDNPRRLRSIHTRCTCCHPDHAGESGLDRTHTRVRNLKSRTIHSASRRHGARESGLSRTRIRARSSSNRNVCILLPYLFFLSPHIIPHGLSPRHTPAPNWKLATLGLATLSHWQHSPIGNTSASPGGASAHACAPFGLPSAMFPPRLRLFGACPRRAAN